MFHLAVGKAVILLRTLFLPPTLSFSSTRATQSSFVRAPANKVLPFSPDARVLACGHGNGTFANSNNLDLRSCAHFVALFHRF